MNKFLKYFYISIFLFFSFLFGAFFYLINHDWVDFQHELAAKNDNPSVVLDDKNEVLFSFKLDKRDPVSYDKLPKVLISAFVAAEDWNFFTHSGLAYKSMLRSLLVNIHKFRIVQGASTITQQVAKLLFLSQERTFIRKIKDIFLSFQLERQFTKEQILELYLNNVYFGRGIYGVAAASQRMWGKEVKDISLSEAATLAATAKSALIYSPLNSIQKSIKRRNLVLNNMLKLNFITDQEYKQAINTKVFINDKEPGDPVLLYIKEWIRNWAESVWGKDVLYKAGYKIKTTINLEKQKIATDIFRKKIKDIRGRLDEKLNGGMISIEAESGKIKVLIGGFDFNESQFNRVLQAKRQIGSAFKPFLYASAIKAGMDMDDVLVDEAIEMEVGGTLWRPKNWNSEFAGEMTLLKALTLSNNIIAIKLLLKLGYEHVIKWAKNFQINTELKPYPSLALGTAELTVKDLATSFNVFANNGYFVNSYFIENVRDVWGKVIWKVKNKKINVLDSITNSKMINALSYRIERAKDMLNYNKWIDAQAIGKTGSTNDATSTWFIGSTPELTTCVYIGRDDNSSVGKNVFASSTVFPIWLDFNINLNFEKKFFYYNPDLKEININWNTGEKVYYNDGNDIVKILK
ncbi:PBP1A family penicillin-binding protein [Candidatus Dependentiae bacterium]|nr:PBP1A family penicillin-binding protein [Candidatus Dependentiae bacterium]MBU4387206.1 PBP1A family penicillin-binding protein [Candidatus Dependentiae bacterium]